MIGTLYVTGPAGTGKSTFSGALKEWLQRMEFDAAIINLDPGADYLPYEPDFDIREYISLEGIMSDYNLGPNGSQIVAADMIINFTDKIKEFTDELQDYYLVVDTPGQIELFTFRTSSTEIVDRISGEKSMIAYIADAPLATYPSGFIAQKMLYASVFSRFFKPMMFVLNKIDLVSDEDVETVKKWERDPDLLNEAFIDEKGNIEKDYFLNLLEAFKESNIMTKVYPVSSRDSFGFEDIYSNMSMFFTGGEDNDTYNE
ncbi:hypothetical membrane protein [Thermoplasma volcanium GSS1]|uniref:Hypothetical membrane protein n=1 Tax=Thermoplasma volcanium (strain ATCC 51530 / DSM 4299 / JCM 9571 / NBRC 15438 / GSS1) TaxID=273116 RepID=Q97CR5_THEVO|nr:ATP/GTP-binding protein [Thermoplasma volcanium]BAB59178.1 hypothetical membrane protein [Thermoplasma volcanium GSS1]